MTGPRVWIDLTTTPDDVLAVVEELWRGHLRALKTRLLIAGADPDEVDALDAEQEIEMREWLEAHRSVAEGMLQRAREELRRREVM